MIKSAVELKNTPSPPLYFHSISGWWGIQSQSVSSYKQVAQLTTDEWTQKHIEKKALKMKAEKINKKLVKKRKKKVRETDSNVSEKSDSNEIK